MEYVYIIIDSNSHSHEAILAVYGDFEKAMTSEVWEDYDEVPDKTGHGESLFISKTPVR